MRGVNMWTCTEIMKKKKSLPVTDVLRVAILYSHTTLHLSPWLLSLLLPLWWEPLLVAWRNRAVRCLSLPLGYVPKGRPLPQGGDLSTNSSAKVLLTFQSYLLCQCRTHMWGCTADHEKNNQLQESTLFFLTHPLLPHFRKNDVRETALDVPTMGLLDFASL